MTIETEKVYEIDFERLKNIEIEVEQIDGNELKPKYTSEDNLGFGQNFTDRMFWMEYSNGSWQKPMIKKNAPFKMDPAAVVFHYAQEIFEGMKAYRTENGNINLFRPELNIERLNKSAERMVMPTIDPDIFIAGLKKLLELEKDWAPKSNGATLYIRPTFIAVSPRLGVQPANDYYFYII